MQGRFNFEIFFNLFIYLFDSFIYGLFGLTGNECYCFQIKCIELVHIWLYYIKNLFSWFSVYLNFSPVKVVDLLDSAFVSSVLCDSRSFIVGFSHFSRDAIELVALTTLVLLYVEYISRASDSDRPYFLRSFFQAIVSFVFMTFRSSFFEFFKNFDLSSGS